MKKLFVVEVLSTRRKPSLLCFAPFLGELREGGSQKHPSAVGTRGSAEDFSGCWPCPVLVAVAASLSQLPREARVWSGVPAVFGFVVRDLGRQSRVHVRHIGDSCLHTVSAAPDQTGLIQSRRLQPPSPSQWSFPLNPALACWPFLPLPHTFYSGCLPPGPRSLGASSLWAPSSGEGCPPSSPRLPLAAAPLLGPFGPRPHVQASCSLVAAGQIQPLSQPRLPLPSAALRLLLETFPSCPVLALPPRAPELLPRFLGSHPWPSPFLPVLGAISSTATCASQAPQLCAMLTSPSGPSH